MARMKSIKSIDEKIAETEMKLQKLKERCDKAAQELDQLYTEKKKMEDMELLNAIHKTTRSKAEILAFLESRA